ncbi:DUF975 family protein [Fructilactobacillus myrtifloralis]|uniref:DUF975 family protein n=1 Tax=Fructilactobacillus myrtifloralis TaxID=2940301 RepID=A0ABY5BTK7_9LACO|nr:DUF975 family protein [Fructilactobacillus myrtifloralis]USS85689.1 DUF975 family protein [Fructilactobacillus myrtifloralis]
MNFQLLKQKTLRSFAGNWAAAILVGLPFVVITYFTSSTGIIYIILSSFTTVGMVFTFSDWFAFEQAPTTPLTTTFRNMLSTPRPWGPFLLCIVVTIYTFLWSLLLVVPGIIKGLAYSQALFIYREQVIRGESTPDLNEVITESRQLMDGHKLELFWLNLSFIGWAFLSVLTLGLGFLWLVPYYVGTMVNYHAALRVGADLI